MALACAGAVVLSGTAAADVAPVAVTPTVDFGRAVLGGGPYTKLVEFYNGTSSSFQLLSPMGATFGDFSVGASGTCPRPPSPLVLAPGQTCNVTVQYMPTASGPQAVIAGIGLCPTDVITIATNPDGTKSGTCPAQSVVAVPFALTGSGVAAETLTAGPESLSFGSVPTQTQGESQTVTLTNGSQLTSITGLSKSGPGAADFTIGADSCTGVVLAPHATCMFNVLFAPSQTGERNAALQVEGSTLGNPYPAVSLSGVGGPPLAGTVGQNSAPAAPLNTGTSEPHNPSVHRGSPVKLELVTCKAIPTTKRHRITMSQCKVTVLESPLKSGGRTANRATLARGSHVYATGSGSSVGGSLRLVVLPTRPLQAGMYTLTIRTEHRRITTTVRVTR